MHQAPTQDSASGEPPGCRRDFTHRGCPSPRAPLLAVTPTPQRQPNKRPLWSGAGGTKGGKKGANPLRPAAAPTAAHLLAGRRDRPSSRPASRKASKAAPNERPPGQPRSPRQTQAWPGAWEGAGLIRGRIWLKAPPQEGDPGLIPACPGPSLPTPLGPAGARGVGGEAGIQGPPSKVSAGPSRQPYLSLAAPYFTNGLSKAKVTRPRSPGRTGSLSQRSTTISGSSCPLPDGETEAQGQKVTFPRSQTW